MYGAQFEFDLGLVHAMVGEYDAALGRIEYVLSISSMLSAALLRVDPRWDPLRGHPSFDKLLKTFE